MIDVTTAVARAREAFLALHEDTRLAEVRLAEAELTHDDRFWQVTFSFSDDEVSAVSKHKTLTLDAESGQVRSVKVRTL